jgi:tetratricopeptide (TPR) repeat protein
VLDGFTLLTRASLHVGGATDAPSPPDVLPLTVGWTINGRYTVVRILGHGGMGWVYEVHDALHPGRAVALKIVRGLGHSPQLTHLFEAEFRTMSNLEHPNVAHAYDFEQIHGTDDCIITMERIEGVPIDEALEERRDWRSAVDSVVQICRALSYVHSRGIVHHDLKPSNVLVQQDGVARVIDFGIARDAGLTLAGIGGTPRYMAPELLVGSAGADHRADLYSLGVTLYELLTGTVPCPARRPEAIAAWALTNHVRLPDTCEAPQWLSDVVQRLCAPDPDERFRSANAVIEAINAGSSIGYQPETSETRQSYVLTPRFTGRRIELASVMEFVERRLVGKGGEPALLVSGESGIGKSRLMRELRQQAQLRRIVFVESNCYEASPTEYAPIADLLEQLVPIVEQLDLGDIVPRALPELTRIAPRLRQGRHVEELPRPATAEDERARLLEAVSTFLVSAAHVLPFVLYVNDLQWSGRGPAQVFAHLAERIRDDESRGAPVPLALLGSFRTEETGNRPVGRTLQRVREESTAIELMLCPLEAEDVRGIVQSMLGIDHVPAAFLERMASETGGNPFYVQELMRMLVEDGTVHRDGGEWTTVAGIGELPLPASIAETFRRRFGLLTAVEQDVLRALAVQARPMPLDLLGAVLDNVRSMLAVTRQLGERGLIVRTEGLGRAHAIAHDRMREIVYADLDEGERRAWHRRIGELIERRAASGTEEEPPLDELAHHFWHAAEPDKALEYAIPAGERSMARYANQVALEDFEHALALMEPDDERRATISEHRADMLVRLSEYENALAAYDDLSSRLEGQPFAEARIHRKLADIHMQSSQLESAVEYGWKALAAYGEKRPRGNISWALATLGSFLGFVLERRGLYTPRRDETNLEHRVAAYDKLFRAYFFLEPKRTFLCTLRLWRIAGVDSDFEAMACAKSGIAMMIGIAGLRSWAYELFEEARKDADSAGSRWWSGTVEMRRGVVTRHAGLWNLEPLDFAVDALRDAGDMFDLGAAVYHAADVCYHAGEIDEAFERARAQNAATARIEPEAPPSVRGTRVVEAVCTALRGELDERKFEEIYELGLGMDDVVVSTAVLFDWGEMLVRHGRVREAIELMERGYRMWKEERLLDSYSSSVLYRLPLAYLKSPTLDRARARLLRRVQAQAMRKTRRMHRHWRSPVLANQALLLERAGKAAEAEAKFREAVDVGRRQNAGLFVSTGLYEWGLVLLDKGEPAAAVKRFEESIEIARAGGNVWLANRCREALDRATSG